jgi:hypothetical protein
MASAISPSKPQRAETFPPRTRTRKRAIPGVLFKPSFRFSNRRRQISTSTPIDPLSTQLSTFTPSPEDPPVSAPLHWSFGKPCSEPTSRRGRDLGSASSSLRTSRHDSKQTGPSSSSSPRLGDVGFAMHPGTLVDFSASIPSGDNDDEDEFADNTPSEKTESDVEIGTWTEMLIKVDTARTVDIGIGGTSTSRRRSMPRPESWKSCHPPPSPSSSSSSSSSLPPMSTTTTTTTPEASRLTNIDYKAAKLHRRARSEELRERSRRESHVTRLHAHSHSESPSSTSTSTNGTSASDSTQRRRNGSWRGSAASSRSSVDDRVRVQDLLSLNTLRQTFLQQNKTPT